MKKTLKEEHLLKVVGFLDKAIDALDNLYEQGDCHISMVTDLVRHRNYVNAMIKEEKESLPERH